MREAVKGISSSYIDNWQHSGGPKVFGVALQPYDASRSKVCSSLDNYCWCGSECLSGFWRA